MANLPARFADALLPLLGAPDDRIGIAVSGGPDSLALLLLAHALWPDRIAAATVDHALRPGSAREAEWVGTLCAARGIPHAVLRGEWTAPAGIGVQAAARDHRYRLLGDWCRAGGIGALATAHHADDQAETVLMRLMRGSGVAGLSGIRPVLVRDGIRIVRPLLRFARRELGAHVAAAGIDAIRDPSNEDPRYDRTLARTLLAEQPLLRPDRLAAVASHLADAETALVFAAHHEGARRVGRHRDLTTLDIAGLPAELLRRVVADVLEETELEATGGNPAPPPTGPDLARLIARVAGGITSTLGHVQVRRGTVWTFRPLFRPRRR